MVGELPPSKASRTACWHARDAYYACLDQSGLWLHGLGPQTHQEKVSIDPTNIHLGSEKALSSDEARRLFPCKLAKEFYNTSCLPSWSEYFDSNRVKDCQKRHLISRLESSETMRNENKADFWKGVAASKASN